jgi:hypothetical protein
MAEPGLSYTLIEIRSMLPSGWSIADHRPGEWQPGQRAFRATIHDGADVSWPLEVKADAVTKMGRMEALRAATDSLVRKALG